MGVKVHVVYCGSCGYGGKFRNFKQQTEAKFGSQAIVSAEQTQTTTGFFEVYVDDQLVWSKKDCGKFPMDTEGAMADIFDLITAAAKK